LDVTIAAVGTEEEQNASLFCDSRKRLSAGDACLVIGLVRGKGCNGSALVFVQ